MNPEDGGPAGRWQMAWHWKGNRVGGGVKERPLFRAALPVSRLGAGVRAVFSLPLHALSPGGVPVILPCEVSARLGVFVLRPELSTLH